MRIWNRRDLTILSFENEQNILLSCDSCGGIGQKEGDILRVPSFFVGKFTTRVALVEIICSGAVPVAISNGVCCEMEPTASEILRGIRSELVVSGYTDVQITGSTEDNFKTIMTGVGLTVVGAAKDKELRFQKGTVGDKIILVGNPRVGDEVDLEDNTIYEDISLLLNSGQVLEIVPVGSKGILYEAEGLAELNGLTFKAYGYSDMLKKSAGPASCLVALCKNVPCVGNVIGELI